MKTSESKLKNILPDDNPFEPELRARFNWIKVKDRYILDIDLTNASEKEVLAVNHASRYYGDHAPTKDRIYMMTNMSGAKVTLAIIRSTIRQIKQKKCFHMVCGYGSKSTMLIVGARLIGAMFGNGGVTFETREEAIDYLMSF